MGQRLILVYDGYEKLLNEYLNLNEFKLLKESTINLKRLTLTLFFNFMYERNITEISSIAHSDIYDFLEYISNRYGSNRKSSMSFILRHFFNYTYQNRMTGFSGIQLFPVIFTNKRDRILSFYSLDEIKDMIHSVDRLSVHGKRDYAILLLFIETGIRSSDLRNLKISNIQWDKNLITFTQCKTNLSNILVISDNLKFALIDYLKNERPESNCEYFFLTPKSLKQYKACTVHKIVSSYFIKGNIDISKRHHGPHALRHSLANNLLSSNAPMHVIQSILGHKNLNTTQIYLNIDIESLKKFALEVPNHAG
ncbi:tyrosine-type recombinase/integrase [Thomasclavelia spiroformis]|uniref:tyrosine-type recombinase/integrase n=1 Tax=Thomasclavelia spiroformis TaxID=29348 RepID=UPI000B37734B|nr:tyrosine-type recombinase/integrase [Thomasclavelia spiroformis]OUO70384.1 hypothetical protein B5F64_06195 [Thomasclavelia spiroformis]